MIDARARELLAGLSRTTGSALGRAGVSPNMLTAAGLGLTALAAWRIVERDPVTAAVILTIGGVLDFLDGAVARATGRASRFGAFLDSVTDRVSDGLVLGALAWRGFQSGDRTLVLLALTSLVLSQLVSYVRAKAESLGYDCKVGLLERAERVVVIVVGLVFDVVVPALWVVAVLSAVTFVQRIVHVRKQERA